MKTVTLSAPFAVIVVVAVFLIGGAVGAWRADSVVNPPPIMKAQSPEPPLAALGDADRTLLNRLLPHIRQTAKEQIQEEFKAVADDLNNTDPKLGAPVGGFGSFLGVAIAGLVKTVIKAVIASIILSVLTGLAVKYWVYPAGFVALWLAATGVVSAVVAKGVAKK